MGYAGTVREVSWWLVEGGRVGRGVRTRGGEWSLRRMTSWWRWVRIGQV